MSGDEDLIDAQALATVGPERLATLLVEAAMRNSSMQRRLQFELIAHKGEDVAAGVRQWSSELAEQSAFLDAKLISELADELDALRLVIGSDVRRAAPDFAPDLMWQILSLAGTIFERTSKRDGRSAGFSNRPALISSKSASTQASIRRHSPGKLSRRFSPMAMESMGP